MYALTGKRIRGLSKREENLILYSNVYFAVYKIFKS